MRIQNKDTCNTQPFTSTQNTSSNVFCFDIEDNVTLQSGNTCIICQFSRFYLFLICQHVGKTVQFIIFLSMYPESTIEQNTCQLMSLHDLHPNTFSICSFECSYILYVLGFFNVNVKQFSYWKKSERSNFPFSDVLILLRE